MNLAVLKKYLVLEICALVVLAALAVIGFKLATAMRKYGAEKRGLKAAMDRKDQLDRRSPYPSSNNVRRETENYREVLDNYNELNDRLRARQIEPQAMQPVEFISMLEKTQRQIGRQLAEARVLYPPAFKFSFDRYAGGKPPAREDVPRLVQQLKTIDSLCQALGKARVAELVSMSREEFEGAPEARGRAAAAARPNEAPGEEALFTTQHFKLAVRADEAAVTELLNLMARYPVFTVVTSLEMTNLKPVPRGEAAAGAHAAAAAKDRAAAKEPAEKERPVIIGRELVELKLELDVYRFAPSLDFRENAGKKR